jgi:hypothetical protein
MDVHKFECDYLLAGYVGGVQCDAWLGSHIPQGTAPLYKTRFPRADGWTNPMAADLKLPFNTTLAVSHAVHVV